ncbi:MAG: amino acid ABC transporter permease [Alphaproteobacteria bacterium]
MTDRGEPRSGPRPSRPLPWNDPRIRAILYQILLIAGVVALGVYLVSNTLANLEQRQIRTGYGFLDDEAGFFIGESLIPFDAADSYGLAFLVGLLNTIRVAVIGIVLATALGTLIGIARLSRNWIVAKLASVYVETLRNIPLLLQLFFWYATLSNLLPAPDQSITFGPSIFLNREGLRYPVPESSPAFGAMGVAFLLGLVASWVFARWSRRRQSETGQRMPVFLPSLAAIIGLPILAWLAFGAPLAFDLPHEADLGFEGGAAVTPEFMALLLGLVTYTASFIAEIVRAGILAVPWGQTEAAGALGLRRGLVLRLVLLPQALRVIIPPMTSQYLNLTKNSSLAVAIGYPDLVSVANTTLNQTGQAIECISIIMAVYLAISLSIAAGMNLYNRRIALVER